MGATGAGAQSYSFPIIYNEILGTKLRVIAGYSGTPDRILAIERGEVGRDRAGPAGSPDPGHERRRRW